MPACVQRQLDDYKADISLDFPAILSYFYCTLTVMLKKATSNHPLPSDLPPDIPEPVCQ